MDHESRRTVSELIKTHAERLAVEEAERQHRRHQDLEQQRMESNSPDARIRIWERLHGLRLPSDPSHPILDVVAVSTRLTLAQVQEEQKLRRDRRG